MLPLVEKEALGRVLENQEEWLKEGQGAKARLGGILQEKVVWDQDYEEVKHLEEEEQEAKDQGDRGRGPVMNWMVIALEEDDVFALERVAMEKTPPTRCRSPGETPPEVIGSTMPFAYRPLKRSFSEESLYSQESYYEYDLKHLYKSSTSSYESSIISEAHGLITDMLADSNLPPHVISGLRTVSNLLKPPDAHAPIHKPKVSPLVSLTETSNYGSDSEDLPYTGERPSSLPKRLRRSLPPSLIRRMSTSTWTTTTSATGMPTLEPEPCRTRSSSFRQSRDSTPGASPAASRSNSPSPCSPTTISLTIPKSRSFSVASSPAGGATPTSGGTSGGTPLGGGGSSGTGSAAPQKRNHRERRSLQYPLSLPPSSSSSTAASATSSTAAAAAASSPAALSSGGGEGLSPNNTVDSDLVGGSGVTAGFTGSPAGGVVGEDDEEDNRRSRTSAPPSGRRPHSPATSPSHVTGRREVTSLPRRLNVTSDYESSDSPGNSDDPGDHVTGVEEAAALPSASSDTNTGSSPGQRSPAGILKKPQTQEPGPRQSAPEGSHAPSTATQAPSCSSSSSSSSSSSDTTDSTSSFPETRKPVFTLELQDSLESNQHPESESDLLLESNLRDSLHPGDASPEVAGGGGGGGGSPIQGSVQAQLPFDCSEVHNCEQLALTVLSQWDYPIFELADKCPSTVLSKVSYKIFLETGLFETFRIPLPEFLAYFHALELGYREKPYHNRVHATDVLHGVYYLTTQPIPGFTQVDLDSSELLGKQPSSSESDSELSEKASIHRPSFTAEDTYGIMGGNFPALELMALYTAAAMHDYDHPGRTNAFLVATHSSLAVLYNDRSVLESHHAASAWELLLSDSRFNWLCHLEKAEFKRFRFLVIEAILATDLKRHFEMVAEFNAKANDEDAPGIDWTNETDRLLCSNMVIKLADINGPTKVKDLHVAWTDRITEEFYEQGDEEATMGMPISPYMDRRNPQLAKLQESFINHLVAPLCNCLGAAGLLPGTWVDDDEEDSEDTYDDSDKGESMMYKDAEDEETDPESSSPPTGAGGPKPRKKSIHCWLTAHLEENHTMWVGVIKRETAAREAAIAAATAGSVGASGGASTNASGGMNAASPGQDSGGGAHLEPIQLPPRSMSVGDKEMEAIKEEDTPPNSANSLKDDDQRRASLPAIRQTVPSVTFAQPAVTPPGAKDHKHAPHDSHTQTPRKLVSCLSRRQTDSDIRRTVTETPSRTVFAKGDVEPTSQSRAPRGTDVASSSTSTMTSQTRHISSSSQ